MPQQHEIQYLNFKQKLRVNLALQSWHFLVPLCVQVQSAMVELGTEQDIFRKASRESEAIKGYCHAVGEYFHAFLNLLAVLSISDHCAVIMVKNLDSNFLIDVCYSGEWISIPAGLIVVLPSCWEGFKLSFPGKWNLNPSHLNWFNSKASKWFPESGPQESTWRSAQRNPSHSSHSQHHQMPKSMPLCSFAHIWNFLRGYWGTGRYYVKQWVTRKPNRKIILEWRL